MKYLCSGIHLVNCDPTCVHATPHEIHKKGCMCEDCNTDNHPNGGVGCLCYDHCTETLERVICDKTTRDK
jgi:hypothetical protein